MGIRSRLKTIVAKRMGGEPRAHASATPPAPSVSPPAPPAAAAPAPKPVAPAPKPVAPAAPSAPAPASPEIDPEMAAKAAKHFEKTRKAVLQFVIDQDGVTGMGEMHDYSERRYFIAHRKFSDLMEGILADGLITYDEGAGEASITEAGRAYVAG
jgi:hypothetical protein